MNSATWNATAGRKEDDVMNRKHKNKGFTLVELIVVIVILAILAAILVPSLLGWIDKSRESKYLLDARNAVMATQSVLVENYASASLDESDAGNTFLTANKDKILEIADMDGNEDIENMTFVKDATTGKYIPMIQTLTYKAENGTKVLYDKDGNPVYQIEGATADAGPSPGAPTYIDEWPDILDTLEIKNSGNMKEAIKNANGGNLPSLEEDEKALITVKEWEDGTIIKNDDAAVDNMVWAPLEVTSSDSGYLVAAIPNDGSIMARMVYYNGNYYAAMGPWMDGKLKYDNIQVNRGFNISDLDNAKTLEYYKEHKDEINKLVWVKL